MIYTVYRYFWLVYVKENFLYLLVKCVANCHGNKAMTWHDNALIGVQGQSTLQLDLQPADKEILYWHWCCKSVVSYD